MSSLAVIDRLYNSKVGRTRAERAAEMDIYLPIQLPTIESLKKCNPEATSITRTEGGPLIVCYVRGRALINFSGTTEDTTTRFHFTFPPPTTPPPNYTILAEPT